MKIAVIGYSQTKFGEYWDKGLRDLISLAGNNVIKNANIENKEINSIEFANNGNYIAVPFYQLSKPNE